MELLARLKVIAPEFAQENEQFLLDHLTISQESISSMIRQPLLDNLIVYLAAHNIDLALKRKGSGGQVKSIKKVRLVLIMPLIQILLLNLICLVMAVNIWH